MGTGPRRVCVGVAISAWFADFLFRVSRRSAAPQIFCRNTKATNPQCRIMCFLTVSSQLSFVRKRNRARTARAPLARSASRGCARTRCRSTNISSTTTASSSATWSLASMHACSQLQVARARRCRCRPCAGGKQTNKATNRRAAAPPAVMERGAVRHQDSSSPVFSRQNTLDSGLLSLQLSRYEPTWASLDSRRPCMARASSASNPSPWCSAQGCIVVAPGSR